MKRVLDKNSIVKSAARIEWTLPPTTVFVII